MKLISWNVNGIRAAVRKGFGDFLVSARPDIIALQEIKIDDARRAKEAFDFKGYEEIWHPAKRPGYSGTAILTKIKPISIRNGFGISEFDLEGRAQTLEFSKFYLINTYFPNARPELARLDYKSDFNAAMLKYIKKLEKTKPVIICGDFNVAREEIDLARPKENEFSPGFSAEERAWGRKYIEAGLVDTYRHFFPNKVQYTWWSQRMNARARNVGWRIDYFLVSTKIIKSVKNAFILDKVMGSDHCPIGIELK